MPSEVEKNVNFSALDVEKAFKHLNSHEKGLSESEAQKRLQQYGPNELEKKGKQSALALFIDQFKNFLILLLFIATIISFLVGELLDSISMLAIMLLSASFGFVQEYRAEKAMEALEKISAPMARVIRNGTEEKIPTKQLVSGDVIVLEAGDVVPADSRIFQVSSLQIEESALTGESVPSDKFVRSLKPETPLADQENMAFAGTVVTYGKGYAVVTATGMRSEFGKIAQSIQQEKETKTPLQVKFEQMGKQLGLAVLSLVVIVFIVGSLKQTLSLTEMALFSLSLAVAAVPSSLPAIVTVSLAMGARELSARKMIIRKLPAAESLGGVTVVCTDKTGTITKNEMTVTKLYFEGKEFEVTGSGYAPKGEFMSEGKRINGEQLDSLLKIGVLCNNANLEESNGKWSVLGDPTEGALLTLARKAGEKQYAAIEKNYTIIQELPFDSERKRMSVIVRERKTEKKTALVKGAPDILLKLCDRILENGKVRKIDSKDVKKILAENDSFSDDALRVLAFAFNDKVADKATVANTERNLVFVGLVGMIDPPRDEVFEAVKKTQAAGIRVVIITGDHALTTKAVAKKIGVYKEGDSVITGEELDKISEDELVQKIDGIRIFARTLPIQKLRIVEALKKKGHVVAMTGDGVNDAPALKKADIGISMGIAGTDVAKEVSKATLADDNFATIVNGISEGRNIFDKIIKSTRYLLSCNTGEIVIVFLSIVMGLPLPLIPLQILMMNLLTDGLPALGLGFEKAEDVMSRPPRNPKEKPLTNELLASIIFFGIIMGIGSILIFQHYLPQGLQKAQTVAFTTLVMFEMFAALSSRSIHPLHRLNPLTNKWLSLGILSSILLQILVVYWSPLQPIFGTVPLQAIDWLYIMIVASLGFIIMEVSKLFTSKVHHDFVSKV